MEKVEHHSSKVFSFLILFVFGSIHVLKAQEEPIKFGKVTMQELQMSVYEKDTSAEAVILCDYGKSEIDLVNSKLNFERVVRIKILKKSGYTWATGVIDVYHEAADEEKIVELKGYTYNLENGKIVKTKLEKESVRTEKYTDNVNLRKFQMPAVKEGSVIEYTYTISSDFWSYLRDWEFQKTIPVVWSEYRMKIPEYFRYKQLMQGYESFAISEQKSDQESIFFNNNQMTVLFNKNRWVTKDVPALYEEPFMTRVDDYITKIEFELGKIEIPGVLYKTYNSNWGSLTTSLLENDSFGKQLNKVNFLKDDIAGIKAKFTTPADQMAAVCAYVKKNVKWNELNSCYSSASLKKAYENKAGNSADVNLLLVAMLKEVGLEANPVILSTRAHGRINPALPLISKFNYVVAHVQLDENKYVLLDATEPLASYDMLPERCLNGEGRLISTRPDWVALHNNEKNMRYSNCKLVLNGEGELKGSIDEGLGGFHGLSARKAIHVDGKDKYVERLKKNRINWEIESYDFTNLDKTNESLMASSKLVLSESVQVAGNMIYLNPMLNHGKTSNPFKHEQRKFPVDFTAPFEETHVLTLTIPDNYKVEEMPKPTIVDLPEGAGRFVYNITANGNLITVQSRLMVKKAFFGAESYAVIKDFYNYIVTKHAEQIVLKKSN